MGAPIRIAFIGAGKVGCSFARYLREDGSASLAGFFSHSEASSAEAAAFAGGVAFDTVTEVAQAVDLVFITTPDGAIANVAAQLAACGADLRGKVVAHCSGATPSTALAACRDAGAAVASCHPLYAVSSRFDCWQELSRAWFTLEGDDAAVEVLEGLLGSLGNHVARIDADAKDADDAGGSGDAEVGSAFDATYDLGEDDEQREQRPPLHSVAEIAERLRSLPQFAGIRIATLTGRDDDETKSQIMADFEAGVTPILVATTVIEVGVDVAQASCMVIFDADRYGLSQLHQLRGRVGRGGTESGAFLISRAPEGSDAAKRLDVIAGTLDGAEIAQADLEFRGAGDVLGDAQSGGKSGLKLLRVVKDVKIIEEARAEAAKLVAEDPTLQGYVQLAGAVLDFTRGNETFLTSN